MHRSASFLRLPDDRDNLQGGLGQPHISFDLSASACLRRLDAAGAQVPEQVGVAGVSIMGPKRPAISSFGLFTLQILLQRVSAR
jgi:hypothetical protein